MCLGELSSSVPSLSPDIVRTVVKGISSGLLKRPLWFFILRQVNSTKYTTLQETRLLVEYPVLKTPICLQHEMIKLNVKHTAAATIGKVWHL